MKVRVKQILTKLDTPFELPDETLAEIEHIEYGDGWARIFIVERVKED